MTTVLDSKSLSPRRRGAKDSAINRCRRLGRGRRVNVDLRLRFRFGRGRRIYNCRVALFFLSGRICDRGFFLLTRGKKRRANKEAEVFFHVSIGRIRMLII
jgi:hypothetical protein